jgi:hypothetical protein
MSPQSSINGSTTEFNKTGTSPGKEGMDSTCSTRAMATLSNRECCTPSLVGCELCMVLLDAYIHTALRIIFGLERGDGDLHLAAAAQDVARSLHVGALPRRARVGRRGARPALYADSHLATHHHPTSLPLYFLPPAAPVSASYRHHMPAAPPRNGPGGGRSTTVLHIGTIGRFRG